MVRARAGHKDPARSEHLQGSKVEFFVPTEGGIEIALSLGKGGWIKNDRVVESVGSSIVLQQVEGVALDPFNLTSVQIGVLVGNLQRGTGTVHANDGVANLRQMKGETSLVAED